MPRFVEGECRDQGIHFPDQLGDWIAEDNPGRAADAFVDELNLKALGFVRETQRNVELIWLTGRLAPASR